jgi:predicted Abi (CAAX) family protease
MKFDPEEDLPSIHHVVKTFARTLIVPSVPEELIWRVLLLQPPLIPSPSSYWSSPRVLFVNVLFAAYHYHGSVILTEIFHKKNDHDRSYAGAKTVFRDPMFLTLAFVLGNACSYAYQRSGYSLWAPVIVHAVSVTVWLTLLSGEKALSTPGGLSSSNSSSGMG